MSDVNSIRPEEDGAGPADDCPGLTDLGSSNWIWFIGIEVLLKKASLDPSFLELLIDQREKAAGSIGLKLPEYEVAVLRSVPPDTIRQIVSKTEVPAEQAALLREGSPDRLVAELQEVWRRRTGNYNFTYSRDGMSASLGIRP